MKYLTKHDRELLPLLDALGLKDASVIALRLEIGGHDMLPEITITFHPRLDGRYVIDPVDPNKLAEAVSRYRLVPIEESAA